MRHLGFSLLLATTVLVAQSAHAVSPTLLQAVEEQPLTITLADENTRDVVVLTLTSDVAVLLSDDGEVLELPYDAILRVRVRPLPLRTVGGVPDSDGPSQRDDPRYLEGGEGGYFDDENDGYFGEGSMDPAHADHTVALRHPARAYSRSYKRFAFSLGYAQMELTKGITTTDWEGFALGFDGTFGMRVSSKLAVHGTIGTRRIMRGRNQYQDGMDPNGFHTPYRAVFTVAPGLTFMHRSLLLSASAGIGIESRRALVGFSGEALVGMRFGGGLGPTSGVALAFTGTTTMGENRESWSLSEDAVGYRTFTIGPRFFREF